jgi:hypothetical protein
MNMFSREDLVKGMDQFQIPEYMRPGLLRWIENGIIPGSFLIAVLRNDLRGAFEKADMQNSVKIHSYVKFLYNCAPVDCWGSEEKVKRWSIIHRIKRLDYPSLSTDNDIIDDDVFGGE